MAGLAVTFVRTPLHLPGHKAVFWIAPAIACRVMTRARASATTTCAAVAMTTVLLGGELGGGAWTLPLVVLAGVLLDGVAGLMESRGMRGLWWMMGLVLAGAGANLVCYLKRVVDVSTHGMGGAREALAYAAGSYLVWGVVAGAVGVLFLRWRGGIAGAGGD